MIRSWKSFSGILQEVIVYKHSLLCHKCSLKLYHGKEKRYVNIIQIVWAEAQLKWTEAQWKFFLITMNAVSCGLRRKGSISAQFNGIGVHEYLWI